MAIKGVGLSPFVAEPPQHQAIKSSPDHSQTPMDYEYSLTDIARLLKLNLKTQPQELQEGDEISVFYQQEKGFVFPPIAPYSGKNFVSAEEVLANYFDKFFSRSAKTEIQQIWAPFNSAGHWIILKFVFQDRQVEASYIDSLSNDSEKINESRIAYIQKLETKLQEILKRYNFSLKETPNAQGKNVKLQINFLRCQPDRKSCGPIVVANILDLSSEKTLPSTPQRLDPSDIVRMRMDQHQLLLKHGLDLDRDSAIKPQPPLDADKKGQTTSSSVPPLKTPPKESNRNNNALSSQSAKSKSTNDGAASTSVPSTGFVALDEALLFDPDACRSGAFVLHSTNSRVIREDPTSFTQNGEVGLSIEMDVKDAQRIDFQLCKYLEDSPALLLAKLRQISLPPSQVTLLKVRALEQLAKSAEAEIQRAQSRLESSMAKPEEIDFDELPKLREQAHSLRESEKQAKQEHAQLSKEWTQKLNLFYQKILELVRGVDEAQKAECWKLFAELRAIRPLSMAPFYPWLTILAVKLEQNTLKGIIEDAYACDPYLTYALTLQYLRLSLTPRNNHLFHLHNTENILIVLNVLKEKYPRDILIPELIVGLNAKTLKIQLDLSPIADGLTKTLNALASDDLDLTISSLIALKPLLMGHSLLYQYLTLAFILKGDVKKAEELLQRASFLPEILDKGMPSELMKIIMGILEKVFPSQQSAIKEEQTSENKLPPAMTSNTLLEIFLNLAKTQHSLDLTLAKEFIDASAEALQVNCTLHLAIVYFGMRWLVSRLVVIPNAFETYRPLYLSLGKLTTISAYICFEFGKLDPWISERFKKQTKDDNKFYFVVSYPSTTFGMTESETLPDFTVRDNLKLGSASINSIAVSLTKMIYHLTLGLMTSHLTPDYVAEHSEALKEFLPDDPTNFMEILQAGLKSEIQKLGCKTPLFDCAVGYLRRYLGICLDVRPFPVDSKVLDWAKFCVFSLEAPSFSSEQMDQEINEDYYPKELTKDSFEKKLSQFKEVLKFYFPDLPKAPQLLEIALRDAWLAQYRIDERSSSKVTRVTLPQDNESTYSVFKMSQYLFGWRSTESFDEWGARLKGLAFSGPAALDIHLMQNVKLELTPQDVKDQPIIESNGETTKVRGLLRLFLQFWIEFYQKTKEKNEHIAKGGNEDKPDTIEQNWNQGIKEELWASIVQHNRPQNYPNFKRLSPTDRSALEEIIGKKHHHAKEITKLKCNKRPGYIQPQDFVTLLAASLITSTEYDRSETFHSAYVESEPEARQLYRILLDVSTDRLMRRALITSGADNWVVENIETARELLETALNILLGCFHGPETHASGEGPLQIHFNAKITISTQAMVNTHIYFNPNSSNIKK
jgi:hypothetical protein